MFVFQFKSQLDFYLSSFTFNGKRAWVIEKEKCARDRHDKHLKSAFER